MNIYIYNCSNTYNYGSMMMGENFINYLNKVSPNENVYYIETTDDSNIDRLTQATNFHDIQAVNMNSLFERKLSKYDYVKSYFGLKKILSEFAEKIDLVVVLGGDDFTEDYGWKSPLLNAMKFNIIKKSGVNVIMLGQTMGPFQSFRKPIMKKLLSGIDKIYPRDPLTYDYLQSFGLDNISLMDDLALLPLKMQKEDDGTKEYITFCPSELIYRYSKEGSRQDWIEFNLYMIDRLMKKYIDKKVVILAHVLKPEHVDDRLIAREIYDIVKEKYSDRIILEDRVLFPYEVRSYIQRSLFTVSSRMHPIISSIQCETPAIALSYSSKYWGIIGKRYDLDDFIIDIRHLTYTEMEKKFNNTIEKIEIEYNQVQLKMKENNVVATESIMKALNEISNL